jgi:predicted Rdx family selenoprotein
LNQIRKYKAKEVPRVRVTIEQKQKPLQLLRAALLAQTRLTSVMHAICRIVTCARVPQSLDRSCRDESIFQRHPSGGSNSQFENSWITFAPFQSNHAAFCGSGRTD